MNLYFNSQEKLFSNKIKMWYNMPFECNLKNYWFGQYFSHCLNHSFSLQCYGAEDDKTFGIPGEVTTNHSLCILIKTHSVVVLVSPSVHLSINPSNNPSNDPSISTYPTKFQYFPISSSILLTCIILILLFFVFEEIICLRIR